MAVVGIINVARCVDNGAVLDDIEL